MKAKNILDDLYDLFQEKMTCNADDTEIFQAKKKLDAMLNDKDSENAVLDYGIAYEKAGFRFGFTLAIRIMAHCINEIQAFVL